VKLSLQRQYPGAASMIGALYVDGVLECWTLEDVPRLVKVPHETAIPAGVYGIDIVPSPKFGRPMPLLVGVKNYAGILIHWGRIALDTWGCILVGTTRGNNRLRGSRAAFDRLFAKMLAAHERGEPITIEILDAAPLCEAAAPETA